MKIKTSTLIIGAAVAAGVVVLLKKFSNGIEYSFTKIKWLGRDGLKFRFALVYTLTNQNDISATVSALTGKILYGTYELNKLEMLTPITIEPGGTANMEVRFSAGLGLLAAEIEKFIEDKAGFKKFSLKGWMSGKVGQLPFKIPLNEPLELAS